MKSKDGGVRYREKREKEEEKKKEGRQRGGLRRENMY